MTMPLPYAISAASQWQQTDWADPELISAPAAGGIATIELPQLPDNTMWLIDHMVAQCDSSTPTVMRLYRNGVSRRAIRDGTDAGNFSVADWPSGLLMRPTTSLVAQWTGASAGATAILTVQARVLTRP